MVIGYLTKNNQHWTNDNGIIWHRWIAVWTFQPSLFKWPEPVPVTRACVQWSYNLYNDPVIYSWVRSLIHSRHCSPSYSNVVHLRQKQTWGDCPWWQETILDNKHLSLWQQDILDLRHCLWKLAKRTNLEAYCLSHTVQTFAKPVLPEHQTKPVLRHDSQDRFSCGGSSWNTWLCVSVSQATFCNDREPSLS